MFTYANILSSLKATGAFIGAAGLSAASTLSMSSWSENQKKEQDQILECAKEKNPDCDVYWHIEQVGFAEGTFLQRTLKIVSKKDIDTTQKVPPFKASSKLLDDMVKNVETILTRP